MTTDSRAKMIRAAAKLIRTRGLTDTSFSDVVAESGAPRGSIYHHFPDGKEQLAGEAIRWTSEWALGRQRSCTATTAAGVLDCFFDLWRPLVRHSRGTEGCVVAGVAVDTSTSDELIHLVRETFRAWVSVLTDQLEKVGVPPSRARPIAVATVAGMEGALILCRAEGDIAPLETVAAELKRSLATSSSPSSKIRRRRV